MLHLSCNFKLMKRKGKKIILMSVKETYLGNRPFPVIPENVSRREPCSVWMREGVPTWLALFRWHKAKVCSVCVCVCVGGGVSRPVCALCRLGFRSLETRLLKVWKKTSARRRFFCVQDLRAADWLCEPEVSAAAETGIPSFRVYSVR